MVLYMPRKARIDAPDSLHHIISRGIERRIIFHDDVDRDRFVDRLAGILADTQTSCLAWVLMPNHFHLLLKTGIVPIAKMMQRLLTGYVVTFNNRHGRCGKLFQNRYKSILCQEDTYFRELVRYIHLNPIRSGLVDDLASLDDYTYCGHGAITGSQSVDWQDKNAVLAVFGENAASARANYLEYMIKGVSQGRRDDLIGGGVIRSAGGWESVKLMRQQKVHIKGDERILGSSDFVAAVLLKAHEDMTRISDLRQKGYDLDRIIDRASELFGIPAKELVRPGKQPRKVQARSVVAYWSVRLLKIDGTSVGKKLALTQSAVSRAVKRGEVIAEHLSLTLEK